VAFAYLTFTQAVAILASRLQDPSQIYFSQPNELLNAVIESVRLFQALTGSYKQAFSFQTQANQNYYSIASQPGSPVPHTVTDIEVANNVLAALLETPLITGWVGTGQFTFAQLQASLQSRLNRFIGDTGRHTVQQTIPATGELTALPDGVLDVRRAGWVPIPQVDTPPTNPTYPLGRLDEWAEQAYIPSAGQNPDMPISYSVFQVGPLQIRMVPPPIAAGNIDCIFTLSGPTVNLDPANPVVLGIPDDLSPALKWGVLADLLGTDGPSRDYTRAAYCEQRYQEFVQIARIYPLVLTTTINNVSCGVGSVFDMDAYTPDWQTTTGVPSFVGICGRGLACVGQTPDGVYSVGTWLCANAPISGFIQVSRDQIDPIIDYAQHIASFKMAGAEFDGTQRLYQNLVECAKMQNGRLEAIAFYKGQLDMPSRKSELEIPRILV
jgi:hypothetical protein